MNVIPRFNPTWTGSICFESSNRPLLNAKLLFDDDAPYSRKIYETLTRPDLWKQVSVTLTEDVSKPVRDTMVAMLKAQLAANVDYVLTNAEQFYPQLECREEAEALVVSDCSYEAFMKIVDEVPPDTYWSTENNVYITDASGVSACRPINFQEKWNLPIGYHIMQQAMLRHLNHLKGM